VSTIDSLTAELRRLRPDVIVAACFPWRLPGSVLELPPLGCLNIHPSLLPRGRGPDPVFWTYRRGERQTGVTVHLMDAGFDTGPILAQQRAELPVGGRAPELERALMAQGGMLLADVLPGWASAAIVPTPQDERQATAAPVPTAAEFELQTSWSAAQAFTFAYGVAPLNGPLAVRLGESGERIPVQDALDFRPDEAVAEAVADEGRGIVRVRFTPGWVRFLRAGAGRYPLSLSSFNAREKR
jgi:methionyl-tRNA formyltransferase